LPFGFVLGFVAGGRAESAGDHAAGRGGQVDFARGGGQLNAEGVVQVNDVFQLAGGAVSRSTCDHPLTPFF